MRQGAGRLTQGSAGHKPAVNAQDLLAAALKAKHVRNTHSGHAMEWTSPHWSSMPSGALSIQRGAGARGQMHH